MDISTNKKTNYSVFNSLLLGVFLLVFSTVLFGAESTVQVDKPIGEFANSVSQVFFTSLKFILKESAYYRFCVALSIFSVFWYAGRMYFQHKEGTIEESWKFMASNGMMIFLVLYFSIGINYVEAVGSFASFIHALGNSIQKAFIRTSDISGAPEYIAKITNSIIFDTNDLSFIDDIIMGFTLMIYSGMLSLLVLMAYFHTLFADIFIYVLATVGPLVIPLVLIQKLDKIFDGWVNGMISSLFYYLFVKIILSITVMIVGLGYLSQAAYTQFILHGNLNLEPSVVVIADPSDITRPFLFFFVALLAMFGIRSFVSTMVGSSGLSGLSGGVAGAALLRGVKR